MFSTLVGLGTWQLFRLHYKNNVIQTLKSHEDTVEAVKDSNLSSSLYKKIVAEGCFSDKRIFYYRLLNNKPGYEVLVPFKLQNKTSILVSLGWFTDKRDIHISTNKQKIEGILIKWYGKNLINPENNLKKNEWFSLDERDIKKYLGFSVDPYLILMTNSRNMAQGVKVPFDVNNIPNRHLEYAVTWFSFAFILAIIFIIDLRRKI